MLRTVVGSAIGAKRQLVVCAVILAAAGVVTLLIFTTEPTAKRGGAKKETAMLVDVVPVERSTFRPVLVATGTVRAPRDVSLSPRVSGQVVERAEDFNPGGFVEEGETLMHIDPADYQNALQERKGALSQARANLRIEMGQQDVARQEYDQLFDDDISPQNEQLVLREPQLAATKMAVEAAEAAVARARLDLGRTTIQAPFDAHVLSRTVDVGSQVAPGMDLGRLVGVETYWVMVDVPLSKRSWLLLSGGEDFDDSEESNGTEAPSSRGSKVRVRNRSWPEGTYRQGHVDKLVGALDEQTRMARVIVTIDDPLLLDDETREGPPLVIGEFVEARIFAKPVEDVVRLDRDYVRKNDTAWVYDDGKLHIVELDIVLRDSEYAYVRKGLEHKERVVRSNLATVAEGVRLRLAEAEPKP